MTPRLGKLRLDFNENLDMELAGFLYKKISAEITSAHFGLYPDIEQLYFGIARKYDLAIDRIYLSAGSDASIRSVFNVFVGRNDKIILPNPTFSMYEVYCRIFQARCLKIDYGRDFMLPLDKLFKAIKDDATLLVLPNPDSPSGSVIDSEKLEELVDYADKCNVITLIDEAYFPFYGKTTVKWVDKFDNLIVIRSFSKAFGLAGFRVGYAVSNPAIINLLQAQKPMCEVSTFGVIAAGVALEYDNQVTKSVRRIYAAKKYFVNELKNLGFKVIPGNANFINVDFGRHTAMIMDKLRKNNIIIHEPPENNLLGEFQRISIATKDIMESVIAVLKGNNNK